MSRWSKVRSQRPASRFEIRTSRPTFHINSIVISAPSILKTREIVQNIRCIPCMRLLPSLTADLIKVHSLPLFCPPMHTCQEAYCRLSKYSSRQHQSMPIVVLSLLLRFGADREGRAREPSVPSIPNTSTQPATSRFRNTTPP